LKLFREINAAYFNKSYETQYAGWANTGWVNDCLRVRGRYPLCKSLGDIQCQSGRVWKIPPPPSTHTPIRSPDRLARSKSLYGLCYPGPRSECFQEQNSLAPAGNRTISPRSLKSCPVTLYRFLHPGTSTAQNITDRLYINSMLFSHLSSSGWCVIKITVLQYVTPCTFIQSPS
jgi:hypothetical protein